MPSMVLSGLIELQLRCSPNSSPSEFCKPILLIHSCGCGCGVATADIFYLAPSPRFRFFVSNLITKKRAAVLRESFIMRYENWDVLLFPANSKVPIQEFKTQCFVTRDRGT